MWIQPKRYRRERRLLPLSERFHCRTSTYRDYEAARRSFYKFICKEGWFWPIVYSPGFGDKYGWTPRGTDGDHMLFRTKELPTWDGFTGRYPVFRDWRSHTFECWSGPFLKHREEWKEEEERKRMAQYAAERDASQLALTGARLKKEQRERKKLHKRSTVSVFRMLAAVTTIDDG